MHPIPRPPTTSDAGVRLGADAVDAFRREGLLRLRGAIPADAIERSLDVIQREIVADVTYRAPAAWPSLAKRRLKSLVKRPEFAFAESPAIAGALDDLLGG